MRYEPAPDPQSDQACMKRARPSPINGELASQPSALCPDARHYRTTPEVLRPSLNGSEPSRIHREDSTDEI